MLSKYKYIVPLLTSARAATSSTVGLWNPRSKNSSRAASRISRRRWAFSLARRSAVVKFPSPSLQRPNWQLGESGSTTNTPTEMLVGTAGQNSQSLADNQSLTDRWSAYHKSCSVSSIWIRTLNGRGRRSQRSPDRQEHRLFADRCTTEQWGPLPLLGAEWSPCSECTRLGRGGTVAPWRRAATSTVRPSFLRCASAQGVLSYGNPNQVLPNRGQRELRRKP